MPKITFCFEDDNQTTIEAAAGNHLLAAASEARVDIDAPCSGTGMCGKCRVRLLEGELKTEPSIHLSREDEEEGWRLACRSRITGDVTVLVPRSATAYKKGMKVADLSSGEEVGILNMCRRQMEESGLEMKSDIFFIDVELSEPTLGDPRPDRERLICALKSEADVEEISFSFRAIQKLPESLREADGRMRCVSFFEENRLKVMDIRLAGDETPSCALAVDIGTTTVSALLIDLSNGEILSKASVGNGQIVYGADVIHRIVEQEKDGGVKRLQYAILNRTINPLVKEMCQSAGVIPENIVGMTVAGNSTMNHLFLGMSAAFLRREPYVPVFFDIEDISASVLSMGIHPEAKIHVLPNIGSYVGGDITSGVLATMLWKQEEMTLFIDLGTNGELVLGNCDFMISCACSAGPAFEGGDISCGMRATEGAIESCVIDRESGDPGLKVIGDVEPLGLCGSGIIDMIAEMFRQGLIDARGKFVASDSRILRDEYGMGRYIVYEGKQEISVTEVDIDNFIRAKGAIFSAMMTMLQSLDMDVSVIDRVLVAGGIGSGINMKNAVQIGMFPDIPIEKFTYVGNTSLAGAYAAAISSQVRDRVHDIAQNMTYMELSTVPGYMDSFVASCFLPHTNRGLFPSLLEDSYDQQ